MSGFYILNDEKWRTRAIEQIQRIKIGEGIPVFEVRVQKYRKLRSLAQNRLYRMWLEIIEQETGHDADDLHELFKGKFLGYETRDVFGRPTAIPISTAGLSTHKFTDYLENIQTFAIGMSISLPQPQDFEFTMGYDKGGNHG